MVPFNLEIGRIRATGNDERDNARLSACTMLCRLLCFCRSRSKTNVDLVRHYLSEGANEAARYLLDPAEFMRLPDRKALILMPRQVAYPILATKTRY